MNKLEDLTDDQIHLMATIATEYESIALSGDDSYSIDVIRKGIDLWYSMAELKSPEIIICTSPLDLKEQAKMKKGETLDYYFGLGYDAGWTAFYDFFDQIGIEYDKSWNFGEWRDFIKNSGVFGVAFYENAAFVCVRPCLVKRNEAGDLHCENGPSIAWCDGYQEYALNGVWVDEELVMTPGEKIDPVILLKEKNAEVRREIVRKIGIERVCMKLGAETIDAKDGYELIMLDLKDGRKREYLKMKNPSIAAIHIEGVPPGTKTVTEALKFRNGVDFSPEVLT